MGEEKVHYFSNGTEGYGWMANWCDRCVNDHSTHLREPDYDNGCPHICSMMNHEPIPAMIRLDEGVWGSWTCMDFRRCSCDRGPDDPSEPDPEPPVHPGQGAMFDADALAPGVPRGEYLDSLPKVPA